MKIIEWEQLPPEMQTEEVRKYYDILKKKQVSLFFKRVFDLFVSVVALIILSPVFLILAIAIKLDSPGPVFFRQERVTQYGKRFRIHKFRSMVQNADKGLQVTVGNDSRITRVGKFIRKTRLDEIAQLFDVIQGTVTLVGVRPEIPKYVAEYTNEMMATLLLPAGVTNLTSIYVRDHDKLLEEVEDKDKFYVEKILPAKMYHNLKGIEEFSLWGDIKILFMTALMVLGKDYRDECVIEKDEVYAEKIGKK